MATTVAFELGQGWLVTRVMSDGTVEVHDAYVGREKPKLTKRQLDEEEDIAHRRARFERDWPGVGEQIDVFELLGKRAGGTVRAGMGDDLSPVQQLALCWEWAEALHKLRTLSWKIGLKGSGGEELYSALGVDVDGEGRYLWELMEGYCNDRLTASQEDLALVRETPIGTILARSYSESRVGDSHHIVIVTDHGDRLVRFCEECHEYGMPTEVTLDVVRKSS